MSRRRARIRRIAAAACLSLLAGCEDQRDKSVGAAAALPPVTFPAVGPQPGPDAVLLRTENPYRDDIVAAVEGRRLFRWYNCEGCHGGRAGGGMGPSLRDADWLYGAGGQEIFNSIAHGRAHGMPAWGTKIPASQIWLLVSYIHSLNTSMEPSPPRPNPSWPDAEYNE